MGAVNQSLGLSLYFAKSATTLFFINLVPNYPWSCNTHYTHPKHPLILLERVAGDVRMWGGNQMFSSSFQRHLILVASFGAVLVVALVMASPTIVTNATSTLMYNVDKTNTKVL
jgi:hypothetical protein